MSEVTVWTLNFELQVSSSKFEARPTYSLHSYAAFYGFSIFAGINYENFAKQYQFSLRVAFAFGSTGTEGFRKRNFSSLRGRSARTLAKSTLGVLTVKDAAFSIKRDFL